MADKRLDDKDTPFHRFAQQDEVTLHHRKVMAEALRSSPELNADMSRAIEEKAIREFGLLQGKSDVNGEYDRMSRTIRIRRDLLDAPIRSENLDKVVDTAGHETTHALGGEAVWRYEQAYSGKVLLHAANTAAPADYTDLVKEYVAFNRTQESLAEIGGLNALASRMRHENKEPIIEMDFAERAKNISSCVEENPTQPGFRLKTGIHFDPRTQTIPPDARNIEAVGQCFFDPSVQYQYLYASHAIELVASAEFTKRKADPTITSAYPEIDLKALGLDAAVLRTQRFNLGPHHDGPFYFVDKSDPQRALVELTHTAPTHDKKHDLGRDTAAQMSPAPPAIKAYTGDPDVDNMIHALLANDDQAISQAAMRIHDSPAGQSFIQQGMVHFDAQQREDARQQEIQAQEARAQEQAAQERRGPVRVMTLMGNPPGMGHGHGGW